MNDQLQIGKATYGRQGGFGGGGTWFKIEDNKDNIYRVLPPIKSMAAAGKYAKFYATHRGFRGSDNKQKPFLCIEEKDFKSQVIKVHCPVCDKVAELEALLKDYKARGAPDEDVRKYRDQNIFPFQAERKYYLNVVNQENKIGILPITSKMFKALEALAQEQEKLGRDITGLEGVFLNFKKQTRFKGDREAIHTPVIYMIPTNDGAFRYASHTITPEFGQRIMAEAADLGNLFKTLTGEQIAQIVSLEGPTRAAYVDSLFAAPEKAAPQQAMQSQIPGSNMVAVSRVEVAPNGGFSVQQPTVPNNFGQATAPNNTGAFQGAQQAAQPTAPPQQAPNLSPPPGFGNPPGPIASAPAQQQAPSVGLPPPAFGGGMNGFAAPAQQAAPPQGFMPGQQQAPQQPAFMPGQSIQNLNDDEFLAVVKPQGK